jgi:hypothetical protein
MRCGDRRVRDSFSHAVAVGVVGDLLADLRQVVRAVGLLEMGQEFRPFAHAREAAAQKVPCGPHGSGIDRGLGQHAAAPQHRNLLGIDLVVFGLAPRDGLHGQGVSQPNGKALVGAEVGEPIPAEDTFDADEQMSPVGCDGLQKRFWASGHVPVEQNLSILVSDTEVHGAGMQIDAAVTLMRLGVEAPEVSSSPE